MIEFDGYIPGGVSLIMMPKCVMGPGGQYFSTNLLDSWGSANLSNMLDSQTSVPQLYVPLGNLKANHSTLTGKGSNPGHGQVSPQKYMPAQKILGNAGDGVPARVIPTTWSLIFE